MHSYSSETIFHSRFDRIAVMYVSRQKHRLDAASTSPRRVDASPRSGIGFCADIAILPRPCLSLDELCLGLGLGLGFAFCFCLALIDSRYRIQLPSWILYETATFFIIIHVRYFSCSRHKQGRYIGLVYLMGYSTKCVWFYERLASVWNILLRRRPRGNCLTYRPIAYWIVVCTIYILRHGFLTVLINFRFKLINKPIQL